MFYSNYKTGEIGGLLGSHSDSVECIVSKGNIGVSCGIDTNINIYDLGKFELRKKVEIEGVYGGGFTDIVFSEVNKSIIHLASTMGQVVSLDVRDGSVVKILYGH